MTEKPALDLSANREPVRRIDLARKAAFRAAKRFLFEIGDGLELEETVAMRLAQFESGGILGVRLTVDQQPIPMLVHRSHSGKKYWKKLACRSWQDGAAAGFSAQPHREVHVFIDGVGGQKRWLRRIAHHLTMLWQGWAQPLKGHLGRYGAWASKSRADKSQRHSVLSFWLYRALVEA